MYNGFIRLRTGTSSRVALNILINLQNSLKVWSFSTISFSRTLVDGAGQMGETRRLNYRWSSLLLARALCGLEVVQSDVKPCTRNNKF
jgi:hypothetical protein